MDMKFIGKKTIGELLKYASKPKIYVDMDGVLVNFNKGFKDLEGISPDEYIDKYSKGAFWKTLLKHPRFFKDLEWMPDGKELWNFVKQYNPTILSAPVSEKNMPHCKEDKTNWIKNHIGDNVEIILDEDKGAYANENDILIDDREKNINEWQAADGVGILHTSTADTISKLKRIL